MIKNNFKYYFAGLIALYLILEIIFNYIVVSNLGNDNQNFWDQVGRFGKILSGFALSFFIFKFYSKDYNLKKLIPILLVIVPSVFYGEEQFINYLINNSSPTMRQRATYLSLLPKKMKEGQIIIKNLDFNDLENQQVVLGIVPSLILFSDNLYQQYQINTPQIIQQYTYSELGGEYGVYNKIYKPIQDMVYTYYNSEYYPDKIKLNQETEKAWNSYLNQLSDYKVNINNYSEKQRINVIKKIKIFYPKFPDDFQLYDKNKFQEAMLYNMSFSTKPEKKELIMAPVMNYEQFSQSAYVNKMIFEKLEEQGFIIKNFSLNYSKEDFLENFYNPIYEQVQNKINTIIQKNVNLYADGEQLEKHGKDSYEILIIPFIALGFSLIGITLNIGNLLLLFLPEKLNGLAGYCLKTSIYLGLFIFPFSLNNELIENPFFKNILFKETNINFVYGYFLNWLAHLQPFLFKIIHWI